MAWATFLLIVAGALVTSNDAGMSVPDWPTSFGSLYKLPPMAGGVKWEHSHRMIAEFIGLLIIVMAVWTQRVESRKWMRMLGWTALGAVIGQGVLGGITVLNFLPWSISTAHATLGQMIFCIVVAMALFTSRSWLQDYEPVTEPELWPSTPALTAIAAACVWVIDLPTGPGLCETCGTIERLWRTFFSIDNGSGLLAGEGLLVGAWLPLSMIGYAVGAAFGLDS